MRGIAIVAALVLGGALLSACQQETCRTASLTQESAASERALSCAENVSIGEVSYGPWCAAVRPELLGDNRYTAAYQTDTYVARTIEDVPIEQAIAVGRRSEGNRAANRAADEECGRWRFAPAVELEQREAERLARSVTLPRTLKLD